MTRLGIDSAALVLPAGCGGDGRMSTDEPVEAVTAEDDDAHEEIPFAIAFHGEYRFFWTFHEQVGQRGVATVDPS